MAPSAVVSLSIAGVAQWRKKSQTRSLCAEPRAIVSIQNTFSETLLPRGPDGSGALSIFPATLVSPQLSPNAAKPNQLAMSATLPSQNSRPDLTLSSSCRFGG